MLQPDTTRVEKLTQVLAKQVLKYHRILQYLLLLCCQSQFQSTSNQGEQPGMAKSGLQIRGQMAPKRRDPSYQTAPSVISCRASATAYHLCLAPPRSFIVFVGLHLRCESRQLVLVSPGAVQPVLLCAKVGLSVLVSNGNGPAYACRLSAGQTVHSSGSLKRDQKMHEWSLPGHSANWLCSQLSPMLLASCCQLDSPELPK